MIDHVSVAVRDLERSARFYRVVLGTLGYAELVTRIATVGYGKSYPEFWLNERSHMERVAADSGVHICFRAATPQAVDAFHVAALQSGGISDGKPGLRAAHGKGYYAAFVRDFDGNRIEAVTFIRE
jgi:catechol 2,3-dioxygenase-like lactoylglutathione lyase family enzyme